MRRGSNGKILLKDESDARNEAATGGMRSMKSAGIVSIAVAVTAVTAFATLATGLDRLALWQVVRACVADYKLTGAPFPCLEVDLSAGEEGGDVVLRPPLSHDTILAPTRKIVGIEDPFLQSPEAPNYFDAAWRARSFLRGPDGREPERDAIALVVNSAVTRGQDQLHIHMGCLVPDARRALAAAAPGVPAGEWTRIGAVVPHTVFWGTRIRGTDLSESYPFQLVAAALPDEVRNRQDLMIMVAGVRVESYDEFLILASYGGVPGAWYPVGAENLLDSKCPAGGRLAG